MYLITALYCAIVAISRIVAIFAGRAGGAEEPSERRRLYTRHFYKRLAAESSARENRDRRSRRFPAPRRNLYLRVESPRLRPPDPQKIAMMREIATIAQYSAVIKYM